MSPVNRFCVLQVFESAAHKISRPDIKEGEQSRASFAGLGKLGAFEVFCFVRVFHTCIE